MYHFIFKDPTPSADSAIYNDDVEALERVLIDESDNAAPLWDRYRAMFSLRNIGTDRAVAALAKGKYKHLTNYLSSF
jgi:hypothetical protein